MSIPGRALGQPIHPAAVAALLVVLSALTALLGSAPAAASERRFTYTYESLVLNPGQIEVEPWTTFRGGREELYLRFDERIELEIGVLENLQMAWYLNATAKTVAAGPELKEEFEFGGISNEWKWKLMDPVADALGLALYGEWTVAPHEAELEAKLIADKRFGDLLVAANLVGEAEWELESADEVATELVVAVNAGIAYLITPSFALGLELSEKNEFSLEGFEHAVVSAGPTLSYASERWWMALTVMPQIADLAALGGDSLQDLEGHERIQTRLLLGLHL